MTYKEKKNLLEGYIAATRRIKCLNQELEQWQTIGTSITQKISPVIVNTNEVNSKIEKTAIEVVELENMINLEIRAAMELRQQVQDIISTVKDSRRRELLTMRYINGVSVRKIAIINDADENSIYKQIRRTITKLDL